MWCTPRPCHEAREQKKRWCCEISIIAIVIVVVAVVVTPRGMSSLFPVTLENHPNVFYTTLSRKHKTQALSRETSPVWDVTGGFRSPQAGTFLPPIVMGMGISSSNYFLPL